MTKTAWIFPGQGSQAVGMGLELKDISAAKEKLRQAEDILGWSILDLCQTEEENLSETKYTQPCLYVVESILADLMRDQGQSPQLLAGHSLGEYVALYVAGVFDFEAGLRLVKRRAELMNTAVEGQMVALIKFNREQLEMQISQTPDVVIANDNSALQVVISGKPEAIEQVLSEVKTKRAIPLKVSGAFHSPLMAPVAQEYQECLSSVTFADAQIPVLSNVDPTPTVSAEVLKARLQQQITGSVRWREIMLQFSEEGVTKAIEIGPGKVLTGLLKRTCPEIALENIQDATKLMAVAI